MVPLREFEALIKTLMGFDALAKSHVKNLVEDATH
jgi:hypothetical protein